MLDIRLSYGWVIPWAGAFTYTFLVSHFSPLLGIAIHDFTLALKYTQRTLLGYRGFYRKYPHGTTHLMVTYL